MKADLFNRKQFTLPPNPYTLERAPRNYTAWNVLRDLAAFRWQWAEGFCQEVAMDVRAQTGRRIQHESVMKSLSEFRPHLAAAGLVVLRHKGRVGVCPEVEQVEFKARLEERSEN